MWILPTALVVREGTVDPFLIAGKPVQAAMRVAFTAWKTIALFLTGLEWLPCANSSAPIVRFLVSGRLEGYLGSAESHPIGRHMTVDWIAARLNMGAAGYANQCLRQVQ
jgi:hypothetical protein